MCILQPVRHLLRSIGEFFTRRSPRAILDTAAIPMAVIMEGDLDIVKMYFDCTTALSHFQKSYESTQRHTVLFRRSADVYQHTETLQKAHDYLKNSHWHSLTNPDTHSDGVRSLDVFLKGKMLEDADKARQDEAAVLKNVGRALSSIRECLIDDMTTSECSDLVNKSDREDIPSLHLTLKTKLKDAEDDRDRLAQTYAQKVRMSKNDLKEQLTQLEYSKNKRLNKFEEKTDQNIRSIVSQKLDNEWQSHLVKLPELQVAIARQEASIHRWQVKLEAVKSSIESTLGEESSQLIEASDEASVEASDGEKKSSTNPIDIDSTIERQSLVSSNISKIKSLENKAVRDSIVSETVSPTDTMIPDPDHLFTISSPHDTPKETTKTTNPPITIALPTTETTPTPTPSTQQAASILSIKTTDDSNNNEQSSSSTQMTSPRTPRSEDSFTFISKRQYEYEHNKENKPHVSLPAIDKRSARKAFVGLDKYALDLFARSPSTSGSPMERGGPLVKKQIARTKD